MDLRFVLCCYRFVNSENGAKIRTGTIIRVIRVSFMFCIIHFAIYSFIHCYNLFLIFIITENLNPLMSMPNSFQFFTITSTVSVLTKMQARSKSLHPSLPLAFKFKALLFWWRDHKLNDFCYAKCVSQMQSRTSISISGIQINAKILWWCDKQ